MRSSSFTGLFLSDSVQPNSEANQNTPSSAQSGIKLPVTQIAIPIANKARKTPMSPDRVLPVGDQLNPAVNHQSTISPHIESADPVKTMPKPTSAKTAMTTVRPPAAPSRHSRSG